MALWRRRGEKLARQAKPPSPPSLQTLGQEGRWGRRFRLPGRPEAAKKWVCFCRDRLVFMGLAASKWVRSMASSGGGEAVRTPRRRGGNGAPTGLDSEGTATSYWICRPCGETLHPGENFGSGHG